MVIDARCIIFCYHCSYEGLLTHAWIFDCCWRKWTFLKDWIHRREYHHGSCVTFLGSLAENDAKLMQLCVALEVIVLTHAGEVLCIFLKLGHWKRTCLTISHNGETILINMQTCFWVLLSSLFWNKGMAEIQIWIKLYIFIDLRAMLSREQCEQQFSMIKIFKPKNFIQTIIRISNLLNHRAFCDFVANKSAAGKYLRRTYLHSLQAIWQFMQPLYGVWWMCQPAFYKLKKIA